MVWWVPLAAAAVDAVSSNQTNKANERNVNNTNAMQREAAQNSIRWRVNDAKAAGLHPLAALGAQGSSPSYQTHVKQNNFRGAGRAMENAAKNYSNQELHKAQLRQINAAAARDEAQAALYASQATRDSVNANSGQDVDATKFVTAVGKVDAQSKYSDAERIQERYGELGEFLQSLATIGGDAGASLAQKHHKRSSEVKRNYRKNREYFRKKYYTDKHGRFQLRKKEK